MVSVPLLKKGHTTSFPLYRQGWGLDGHLLPPTELRKLFDIFYYILIVSNTPKLQVDGLTKFPDNFIGSCMAGDESSSLEGKYSVFHSVESYWWFLTMPIIVVNLPRIQPNAVSVSSIIYSLNIHWKITSVSWRSFFNTRLGFAKIDSGLLGDLDLVGHGVDWSFLW